MTTTIILDTPDHYGRFGVTSIAESELPHRCVMVPGRLENGEWVDTELSGEPQEVIDAAAMAWTPEAKSAYKALLVSDLPIEPDPLAHTLTRRQVRRALVLAGRTPDDVIAAINAIPDPMERALALIDWEDASYFVRNHPLILQLAPAIGLTPEQVDSMWVAAKNY